MKNRLRISILERDGYRCSYCGATAADGSRLEVDHFIPRSMGGADREDNLLTACDRCNNGKSATLRQLPRHLVETLTPGICWYGDKRYPEVLVKRGGWYVPCCHDHWLDGTEYVSTMGLGYPM